MTNKDKFIKLCKRISKEVQLDLNISEIGTASAKTKKKAVDIFK